VSQFLVPVHEISKRPGQMRELELDFSLQEVIGTSVVRVPVGSTLSLNLRLESVHEGILATAELDALAETECSRCLEPIEVPVEVDFQELFAYSLETEDDFLVQDEQIDLEQAITDAVVLSLPFKPVCSETCQGLCSECGLKLAENPNHIHEAPIDSRWSELERLKEE
jgi:uncharacterized protein